MNSDSFEQVRELYHELADLPVEERERRLATCDRPKEVVDEVRALLSETSEANVSSPLSVSMTEQKAEQVAEEVAAVFLRTLEKQGEASFDFMEELSDEGRQALALLAEASMARSQSSGGDSSLPHVPAVPGESSRYRREAQVAAGGMGTIHRVWDQQLDRPLAMKLLRVSGSQDESSRSRFAQRFMDEARTTGRLDHPGVVPVHELGTDDQGKVYFTMRLVQGITLKEVFDKVNQGDPDWSQTRALECLTRACETVAFAHSRGVVHRDLKPLNIMVGSFGETYVMDWGLAKDASQESEANRSPSTDEGDFAAPDGLDPRTRTLDGEVLGTPSYMPPEQARGEIDKIGTASDVYSMGCVLYHLLASEAPYSSRSATGSELLRRVLAGPPRPLNGRTTAAPELVAICEKAMQRDPADRYSDMSAMRDDLRAFLEGRVVKAHRTGPWVELRKWVQRNRGMAITSALALVLALGGLGTTAYVQAEANRELSLARSQTLAANQDLSRSNANLEEVANFQSQQLTDLNLVTMGQQLKQDLLSSIPTNRHGDMTELLATVNFTDLARDTMKRNVLERSLGSIDEQFSDQPLVQAQLLQSIANIARSLNLLELAQEPQARAVEIRREHLGVEHRDTLHSHESAARLLQERGLYQESEQAFHQLHQVYCRLESERSPDALRLASQTVGTLQQQSRYADAEKRARELDPICRKVLGEDHPVTIAVLGGLASSLNRLGRPSEALPLSQRVFEARRSHRGPDAPLTLTAALNVSMVLYQLSRHEEAASLLEETMPRLRRVHGNHHDSTITTLITLGNIRGRQGRLDEALTWLEEAHALAGSTFVEDHRSKANAAQSLAVVLHDLDRLSEAEAAYREALRVCQTHFGETHEDTLITMSNLAGVLRDSARDQEAESLLRESVEGLRTTLGNEHPVTLSTVASLSVHLLESDHPEEAERYCREAWEGRQRALGESHPSTIHSLYSMGNLLQRLGRLEEAEPFCEQAVDGYRRVLGDLHLGTLHSLDNLAVVRMAQGRYQEAEPLLQECFEGRREVLGLLHPDTQDVMQGWIDVLVRGSRWEEAEEALIELLDEAMDSENDPDREGPAVRNARLWLIDFYADWHRHDPDGGYDEKADLWR